MDGIRYVWWSWRFRRASAALVAAVAARTALCDAPKDVVQMADLQVVLAQIEATRCARRAFPMEPR